jgi:hypothetical protein
VARCNKSGILSTFVDNYRPLEKLEIATSYDAFRYALVADGRSADSDATRGDICPPNKLSWIEPSNEARYLARYMRWPSAS